MCVFSYACLSHFYSCDLDLNPITLIHQLKLCILNMYLHTKKLWTHRSAVLNLSFFHFPKTQHPFTKWLNTSSSFVKKNSRTVCLLSLGQFKVHTLSSSSKHPCLFTQRRRQTWTYLLQTLAWSYINICDKYSLTVKGWYKVSGSIRNAMTVASCHVVTFEFHTGVKFSPNMLKFPEGKFPPSPQLTL